MLFSFPFLVHSATWDQLQYYPKIQAEKVSGFIVPDFDLPSEGEKILYQKQNNVRHISDKAPFVGVIECTFYGISDENTSVISLANAQTIIRASTFSNLVNTHAINLSNCINSKIESCIFSSNINSSALDLQFCHNVVINGCSITGLNAKSLLRVVAIQFDTCTSILVNNTSVESCTLYSSPIVASKCNNIVFNQIKLQNCSYFLPSFMFLCSNSKITVQNCQFLSNKCNTYSSGILSLENTISVIHCIFKDNVCTDLPKEFAKFTNYLYITYVSGVVTFYSTSTQAYPLKTPTYIKNLIFDNNQIIADDLDKSQFGYYGNDFYSDTNRITVEGNIDFSGVDTKSYAIMGFADTSKFRSNIKTEYASLPDEPLQFTPNHKVQPFMPSFSGYSTRLISDGESFYARTKLNYILIDGCDFRKCQYINYGNKYGNTVLFIDLENGGAVHIANTQFVDNQVSASVCEICNVTALSVVDVKFSQNVAIFSSAIMCHNIDHVRVNDATFIRNVAFTQGTMSFYNCPDVIIVGSVFRRNSGYFTGGCIVSQNSAIKIWDTEFLRNDVDFENSRVRMISTPPTPEELLKVKHHIFTDVQIHKTTGIAISLYKSSLELENTIFSDNSIESDNETDKTGSIVVDGFDIYADIDSTVNSAKACTDIKYRSTSTNVNLTYDNDKCELNKTYEYSEHFEPVLSLVDVYDIEADGNQGYKLPRFP